MSLGKISVIMACYNSSSYIGESIESILGQSYQDLELILIDDFSSDNTLEIANKYKRQDGRISIVSLNENSGPAAARNAGIRSATGNWLGILDSDDVAHQERFKLQMEMIGKSSDMAMVGSDSITIDINGNEVCNNFYPNTHQKLVRRLVFLGAFPPHSSLLYKKSLVDQLGGFNSRYLRSQDYDLWLRLSSIGRVGSVGEPLVKIRKHGNNISNSQSGKMQLIYGYAATVCYYLRKYYNIDPSTQYDEDCWNKFLFWIECMLEEGHVFSKQKNLSSIRAEYFQQDNKIWTKCMTATKLIHGKYVFSIAKEKLFGTRFPKRLAMKWIESNV